MSKEAPSAGGSSADHVPACPWCSATLPDTEATRCPSCFATLREDASAEVPGVTRVDLEAVLGRRSPARRSRGLIGWLAGEYQPEAPPEQLSGLAPPPNEVRREILRLELAALEAEAQAGLAEQAALAADAGVVTADPGTTAASDAGIAAADAGADAAGMDAGPDADAGMVGESRPG